MNEVQAIKLSDFFEPMPKLTNIPVTKPKEQSFPAFNLFEGYNIDFGPITPLYKYEGFRFPAVVITYPNYTHVPFVTKLFADTIFQYNKETHTNFRPVQNKNQFIVYDPSMKINVSSEDILFTPEYTELQYGDKYKLFNLYMFLKSDHSNSISVTWVEGNNFKRELRCTRNITDSVCEVIKTTNFG
jgi:hypothetical protein